MRQRDIATPLVLIILMLIGTWAGLRMSAPAQVLEILRLFSFC